MTNATNYLIPLLDDQQVVIVGTFPLTPEGWDALMVCMDAMKPGLVRSEPEPDATSLGDDDMPDGLSLDPQDYP